MSTPLAYLNGRFLSFHEAQLSLRDAGFVFGATVVDNARTFRHRLFRWSDHLARFRRDCTACYVPLESTDEQISSAAEELVDHNAKLLPPGGELQLVTFATPGLLGHYVGESANGPATLGMVTYPLPLGRYRPFFTEGATLVAVRRQGQGSETVLPPTIKHRSRMYWHIADHQAREQTRNPHALALLTNEAAEFLETCVSNFLIVRDGVVVSPPRDQVLDGISLRVTQELCGSLRIPFIHAPITILDIDTPEAMLTGTAFCLAGVKELIIRSRADSHFQWPGPLFRRLLAAWSDLVGVDVEGQFTQS